MSALLVAIKYLENPIIFFPFLLRMAENISSRLSYDKNFWILINRLRLINEKKFLLKMEGMKATSKV